MSDNVYEFEFGSAHGFRYFVTSCFDIYGLWRKRPYQRRPCFLRSFQTVNAAREAAEKDWNKHLKR